MASPTGSQQCSATKQLARRNFGGAPPDEAGLCRPRHQSRAWSPPATTEPRCSRMMNRAKHCPVYPGQGALLDAESLAHFDRTGWLATRGFFSADEVTRISAWTDELLTTPEVPGRHMVYREDSLLGDKQRVVQRIENFCPYHLSFDALVRGGRLQAAVEQLLGGPACLFKEKINFKMPGGSGFEAHQDQQAGWTVYAPLFVTVLVSIDPATLENGCLEMADTPRFAGLIGDE